MTRHTLRGQSLRHIVKSSSILPIRGRSALLAVVCAGWVALLGGCGSVSAHDRSENVAGHKPTAAPVPLGVPGRWHLLLNTDFDTKSLNTRVWRAGWFGNGITGPINAHELACYNPRNIALNGQLDLKITKVASTCEGVKRPYTGAMISTNPEDGRASGGFTYTYGVAQARIYVPAHGGLIANWPAFATFGQHWPQTGEDDILEGISGTICSRFHSPLDSVPGAGGCDPGVTPGWHILTANWEPGSITWYYDGIKILHETKGVTTAPMYFVLVNTVSEKWRQVANPATMKVSYVRVWQPLKSTGPHSVYEHSF